MNDEQRRGDCVYRKSLGRKTGRTVYAGNYRARYRDADGEEQDHVIVLQNGDRVRDKKVAEAWLRDRQKYIGRKAVGLVDRDIESARLPVRVVLARFARHLRRRGKGRKHTRQTLAYAKWILKNGNVSKLAEFNAENIDRALAKLADNRRSPRTVNAYRQAAFSVGTWCVKPAKLLQANPVAEIERRDERADTRKERRALTVEEAYRLLKVCGPRKLFYSVLLWTGLRKSEAGALEWRDLDLEGDRPAIRLRAATTKAKRADELPIHPDLCRMLLEAKPDFARPTDRVFKIVPSLGTLTGRTYRVKLKDGKKVKRYRAGDLDRAQIAVRDAQGRSVDLHAMRTTYVSWLGLYGVDPRAQIVLARHAPQGVTMRNYQDFSLFDLWGEISKLPCIRVTVPEAQVLRATGTDDAAPELASHLAPGGYRNGPKRTETDRIADDGRKDGKCVESSLTGSKTAISAPRTNDAGVAQLASASDCGSDADPPKNRLHVPENADSLPPLASHLAPGERPDPDLVAIVEAWGSLPAPIRAGILAMVEAAK